MPSPFPIPYLGQMSDGYDNAGNGMQAMMENQLSGQQVDEQAFSKLVAKRMCCKDVAEVYVKDACRVENMAVKEN